MNIVRLYYEIIKLQLRYTFLALVLLVLAITLGVLENSPGATEVVFSGLNQLLLMYGVFVFLTISLSVFIGVLARQLSFQLIKASAVAKSKLESGAENALIKPERDRRIYV